MNTIDKTIFAFFYDLKLNLSYKDDLECCTKLFKDVSLYLETNQYSDINIKDHKGNTFLPCNP